jgi:hypothetical protein
MTDFAMLDQVLDDFNETTEQPIQLKTPEKIKTNKAQTCTHENKVKDKVNFICTDCGQEVEPEVNKSFDKFIPNRNKLDPNRCQIRKLDEKTIYKDVEKMNFSDSIIKEANLIFLETTNGAIYRGNSRKAIIFACVFHAYKIAGSPQSCESLIEVFQLERKVGLKGLKHVGLNAPKNSRIRTTHITPQDLIREIMKKFEASGTQVADVIELYSQIHNKSSILNRSRPQSVAAGLTYYYILLKQKDISLKDFTKKVKLSDLTVVKITKEIARVLKTPGLI